jgi:aminopeptidase N
VAHEYFHNWTGNRITCRDWFQLCLKEGLTVFRDQSFSADMRGEACSGSRTSRALRARQFAEDAGPLAHPVRPSSYLKIDNFYTATIYEKGAELIRMLKTILGAAASARPGPLFRAPRRRGDHGRGLHRLFRRGLGPRPDELLRLVRAGRHAVGDDRHGYDAAAKALDLRSPNRPPRPAASRTRRPCRSRSPSAC